MTTMIDKLLARAIEYEQRAQHLRIAAAEMNGHALNGKREAAVGTLDAAIALRKAQRSTNGHPGGPQGIATSDDRMETIRALLADGPATAKAVQRQLEAAGQGCSQSWTQKTMRAMKDVQLLGRGQGALWALKGTRAVAPKKAKRKRSEPQTKAVKQRMRERTAKVLGKYDEANPKVPAEVAKALGITVSQMALAPLVHHGYLKKRKGGYIRTRKPYVVAVDNSAAEA